MTDFTIGKKLGGSSSVSMSLTNLVDTRLLIQANSGGGKSWVIRRLLEQTHGKIQQIILDIEGDFSTLRERFDYVLAAKGGDIDVNPKVAGRMARRILELRASPIIDLYELKQGERVRFVRLFLEALMEAPKALWHPCLVVIDEAHILCPEKGQAESMGAVIDLCTRGRKRGFCAVLATQRLSKLHKDAAAEMLNKLIGRTGLDLDMKRAADELGFTSKQQTLTLRDQKPGEFYAFGPAVSEPGVSRLRVGTVQTSHPHAGTRREVVAPAPTTRVKKLLAELGDLPAEAEEEARTIDALQGQVRDLKRKLRLKPAPEVDEQALERVRQQAVRESDLRNEAAIKQLERQVGKQSKTLARISELSAEAASTEVVKRPALTAVTHLTDTAQKPGRTTVARANGGPSTILPYKIQGGAMRMLQAAAMFYPEPISKARMAAIAVMSRKSGTFGTYLGNLKREGLIEGNGVSFVATEAGVEAAGEVEELPTDPDSLVDMWANIVKGGAARMLRVLADAYPNFVTRQELGEQAGLTYDSGTFGTYLSTLKRNGLAVVEGGQIKAADELYE